MNIAIDISLQKMLSAIREYEAKSSYQKRKRSKKCNLEFYDIKRASILSIISERTKNTIIKR